MAFIDSTYIDARLSSALRSALTDADSGVLTALITSADQATRGDLLQAGYTVDPSTFVIGTGSDLISQCSLGYFVRYGHARKAIDVPPALYGLVDLGRRIATGEMPIPGLEPSAGDAVGGFQATESTIGITGAVYPIFSRGNWGDM